MKKRGTTQQSQKSLFYAALTLFSIILILFLFSFLQNGGKITGYSIILTAQANRSACGTVNANLTLAGGTITANSSCFVINASNIVLDGNGTRIIGNHTGNGVNVTRLHNVTIKNINLINFSKNVYAADTIHLAVSNATLSTNKSGAYAVHFDANTTFSNVTNSNITVLGNSDIGISYGIVLDTASSTNNLFFSNTFNATGDSATLLYTASNNTQIKFNNLTNTGPSGIGIHATALNNTMIANNTIITAGTNAHAVHLPGTVTFSSIVDNQLRTGGSSAHGINVGDATSPNLTIRGNNISTSGTSAFGLNILPSNTTITFNNITITGSQGRGIYVFESNETIRSNRVTTNNTLAYGILIDTSTDSIISQNIINTSGVNASGIRVSTSPRNSFSSNIIRTTGVDAAGVYFDSGNSNGNNFTNDNITTTNAFDVLVEGPGTNTFHNTTFNKSDIGFGIDINTGVLAAGSVIVRWNVHLIMQDASGNALPDAIVNITNSTNQLFFTGATNASGQIVQQLLTEFERNATAYINHTPHNVTVVRSGYTVNRTQINLTQTNSTSLTTILLGACGTLNRSLTLSNNISATGNCFVIGVNNLTLDCANFAITGADANYGINATGRTNVTIQNCGVRRFAVGIFLASANNNNFTNNTITNNGEGFTLSSANNNTFSSNTISNNRVYGLLIGTSHNNTFSTNTLSNNTLAGIRITGAATHGNRIFANIITNHSNGTAQDGYGIIILDLNHARDPSIANRIYDNPAIENNTHGIYLEKASFANITNNTLRFNIRSGIAAADAGNFTLAFNAINDNRLYGIFVNGSNNTFINNTLANNTDAAIAITGAAANNSFHNHTIFTSSVWLYANVTGANNTLTGTRFDAANGTIYLTSPASIPNGTAFNLTLRRINVTPNHTFVNSTYAGFLSIPTTITLFNVNFTDPKPTADYEDDGTFADCASDVCTEVNYANLTYIFNVTHFTAYRAAEGSTAPKKAAEEESSAASSGDDGGGCLSRWDCTEWDACTPEGKQMRTCTDGNACEQRYGRDGDLLYPKKPPEVQECIFLAEELQAEETAQEQAETLMPQEAEQPRSFVGKAGLQSGAGKPLSPAFIGTLFAVVILIGLLAYVAERFHKLRMQARMQGGSEEAQSQQLPQQDVSEKLPEEHERNEKEVHSILEKRLAALLQRAEETHAVKGKLYFFHKMREPYERLPEEAKAKYAERISHLRGQIIQIQELGILHKQLGKKPAQWPQDEAAKNSNA